MIKRYEKNFVCLQMQANLTVLFQKDKRQSVQNVLHLNGKRRCVHGVRGKCSKILFVYIFSTEINGEASHFACLFCANINMKQYYFSIIQFKYYLNMFSEK